MRRLPTDTKHAPKTTEKYALLTGLYLVPGLRMKRLGRFQVRDIRTGSTGGAHDLIIAAHALQSDRTVLTFDAKARFGDLPGVSAFGV